jgi:hypothetical protein
VANCSESSLLAKPVYSQAHSCASKLGALQVRWAIPRALSLEKGGSGSPPMICVRTIFDLFGHPKSSRAFDSHLPHKYRSFSSSFCYLVGVPREKLEFLSMMTTITFSRVSRVLMTMSWICLESFGTRSSRVSFSFRRFEMMTLKVLSDDRFECWT